MSAAPPGAETAWQAVRAWAREHVAPPAAPPTGACPWAVAYSGGADSTALLLAARACWPGAVQAFHVHHGLQAAGDGFLAHARQQCAQWNVPLVVQHVDGRHRSGQSPEDAARQARYRALAEMAQAHGAQWVLLGQHAQDQVETLLLALTRGAGLAGLAGMPVTQCRHGVAFARPLLGCDARQLRHELQQAGQPFVEDPSNTDTRYTRNRIRHQLMPVLLQAFPAALDTFGRSARLAAQGQQLVQQWAEHDVAQVGSPPVITQLQALDPIRQAGVLRAWLWRVAGTVPTEAQLSQALRQIAACTTRGHRIHLRLGQGWLSRAGTQLHYEALKAPPL